MNENKKRQQTTPNEIIIQETIHITHTLIYFCADLLAFWTFSVANMDDFSIYDYKCVSFVVDFEKSFQICMTNSHLTAAAHKINIYFCCVDSRKAIKSFLINCQLKSNFFRWIYEYLTACFFCRKKLFSSISFY